MNTLEHVDLWKRKHRFKQRRVKLLGWCFLLIALAFGCFAYFPTTETVHEYLLIDKGDQEGCYMLSGLLAVMGLFCLNSLKKPI